MAQKPSAAEEEYFAREDIEKKRRLAHIEVQNMAAAEREAQRLQHHGHCPACGHALHTVEVRGLQAWRCFACSGTFFAAAELQKVVGEPGYLERMLQLLVTPGASAP